VSYHSGIRTKNQGEYAVNTKSNYGMLYSNIHIKIMDREIETEYVGQQESNEYCKIVMQEYHPSGNGILAEKFQCLVS
jgi:hypothetical protein